MRQRHVGFYSKFWLKKCEKSKLLNNPPRIAKNVIKHRFRPIKKHFPPATMSYIILDCIMIYANHVTSPSPHHEDFVCWFCFHNNMFFSYWFHFYSNMKNSSCYCESEINTTNIHVTLKVKNPSRMIQYNISLYNSI